MIKILTHNEFKRFYIDNDIIYVRPRFSEIYFGYYINNILVGVTSYSKEYSLKNSIWGEFGVENPLTINEIIIINCDNIDNKINFINKTLEYIDNNYTTNIISVLIKIDDDKNIELFNKLDWNNFGYLSGNYTLKNSVFRYIKYIKNIDYYNSKLNFLKYNYDKNIAGIIYKITNITNNKIYIGQTIRGFLVRYIEHKSSVSKGKTNNFALYEAFNKYGFDKFIFEIIDHAETIDELNKKEISYILNLNSMDYGYNLNEGGSNSIPTEETRKKMSEARKGQKRTSEQRKNMSNAKIGVKYSPKTEEQKTYLSENSPKYWLNKKRPQETIDKISKTKKEIGLKPVNSKMLVMVDSDGNLVKIYESAKDCSFDSGYSYDQVYDRLREKYENNLEHKFYYLDKYNGNYNLETDLFIKPRGVDKDVFVRKIKNVVICNSNNELIKIVSSVTEAERESSVNHAAIRRRLSGKHRNQGEYNFHFESDWNEGNLERFVESTKNKPTAVVMFNTISGNIIEEYNSINEAAKMNNIDAGIIKRKCDGKKSRESINNSKLDNKINFRYK